MTSTLSGNGSPKPLANDWPMRTPVSWPVDRLKWSIAGLFAGTWGEEPNDVDDLICVRVADFDRTRYKVIDAPATLRAIAPRERTHRLLQPGDLLIEKSGGGDNQPVGCVVDFDHTFTAVCSNFVGRMLPTAGMWSRYWTYVHATLYSARLNVLAIKQTTGIQNLDTDAYFNQKVPFPPPALQRAIANYLDRETARINALIAAKERLLGLLAEQRQALISRAVTRGLDSHPPLRDSGIPWLGEIPAHWEVVPLMHLTQVDRPIMYGIVLPGPDVSEGVPILKGGNVSPERMNLASLARTTPEIEASYARARLRARDLVYSIRGSIGDCEMVPEELEGANITQDVARVAPRAGVNAAWLRYALISEPIRQALAAGSLGAAVRGINIFDLKRVRIPTPPPDEQDSLVAHLTTRLGRLDLLLSRTQETVALLAEYRSTLIAAAVTGQIEVGTTA